ncbi:MAG: hypothetical protein RLP09_46850 [Sandaracinaceae bacterium]
MSPSISWIDRESFASLVRQLQSPARKPRPSAIAQPRPEAPPASAESTAPTHAPPVRVPRPGATAQPEAPETERPPPPSAEPEPELSFASAFVAPEGSIDERAAALLSWMSQALPGESAFVTDEHGLAVVERNANVELLATSAALMRTVRELHEIFPALEDHITLSLDPNRTLSFALAESDWGHFGAGVVSSGRLAEPALAALTAAVRETFEKKNGSPR